MKASDFRNALRLRLESRADQVVLRVLSSPGSDPVEFTGRDLLEQSVAAANRHSSAPESSAVLLLLPHSPQLFLLHIGLLLTGRVPAILAWPTSRIDPHKYRRNLIHQLENLPAAELLTLPFLAGSLNRNLRYRVAALPEVAGNELDRIFELDLPAERSANAALPGSVGTLPEEALFLQFSGGTTGSQKCVVVTAGMLASQLELLARALGFEAHDAVVSWLPMYHDMGLIACLWLPLWTGAPSLQFAAQDWLMDPSLLFRLMDRFKGTFCWLPNFAFSYLASQRARMKQTFSLQHVKAWINCSEPVRRKSVDAFVNAYSSWGVRSEKCQASYGMAENVFAVTQTALGSAPMAASRSALRGHGFDSGEMAFGLLDEVYVSSGRPLEGMQLRIRDNDGELCGDLEAGNIEIQTPCIFSGYWGEGGFREQLLSPDGWFPTGDYGFTSGSDLFVIGRSKDIVIVGGQNVFPEDVEALANTAVGVYAGRVVAFGLDDDAQGTQNLGVVAEMRGKFDAAAAKRIEREISRAILSGIGISPRWVRVTPEHWIVKSTAGKISRRETRARFLEDRESAPVTVQMGA